MGPSVPTVIQETMKSDYFHVGSEEAGSYVLTLLQILFRPRRIHRRLHVECLVSAFQGIHHDFR
jgi:hypothetical protein